MYFCKENLPKRDEVITLIDEDDNEYPTIYLARKTGLSGGWKGFAVAHNLVDGDALIFQLVQRTTFKVIFKLYLELHRSQNYIFFLCTKRYRLPTLFIIMHCLYLM